MIKIGPLTIDLYRFIPSVAAFSLAWIWFGWRASIVVLLVTVKGTKE